MVDPSAEKIAIAEAKNLNIPVVALIDTNCDPTGIDYVVPANDDAIKSVSLFANYFGNSVAQGRNKFTASKKSGNAKGEKDASLEQEILNKFEKDIDLQD